MADHSISISNSIRCFGTSPSSKWGSGSPYTMTWGTTKWGEGTEDEIVSVEKVLDNPVTIDSSLSLYADYYFSYSNSLSCESETYSEYLQTSNGYFYYFVAPTLDAENRNPASFSAITGASTTYTSLSVSSGNWS